MIGWSWVLLTGVWIGTAGTGGAALAFVAAGLAIVLIALTYAELAAAIPKVGGEHVYAERAFGRHVSFICTWALLLGYIAVVAFEAVALPFALSYLFPAINIGLLWQVAGYDVYASQVAIGITVAVVLTVVNIRGIAKAASLQGFVTCLILIAGLILISGLANGGTPGNMTPLFTDGMTGTLGVLVMIPILFVGFDVIPQAAEEIDLPPALIGRLVVVSVLAAVFWYTSIVLAVGAGPARRQAAALEAIKRDIDFQGLDFKAAFVDLIEDVMGVEGPVVVAGPGMIPPHDQVCTPEVLAEQGVQEGLPGASVAHLYGVSGLDRGVGDK